MERYFTCTQMLKKLHVHIKTLVYMASYDQPMKLDLCCNAQKTHNCLLKLLLDVEGRPWSSETSKRGVVNNNLRKRKKQN